MLHGVASATQLASLALTTGAASLLPQRTEMALLQALAGAALMLVRSGDAEVSCRLHVYEFGQLQCAVHLNLYSTPTGQLCTPAVDSDHEQMHVPVLSICGMRLLGLSSHLAFLEIL